MASSVMSQAPSTSPMAYDPYDQGKIVYPAGTDQNAPEVYHPPPEQPQKAAWPGAYSTHPPSESPRRTMCGLVPSSFWLLMALIVVIIVAAVGGGVGGSMAVSSARDDGFDEGAASCSDESPATVTTTITQTAGASTPTPDLTDFVAPTDVNLALNCDEVDGTAITIDRGVGYTFDVACGTEIDDENDANIIANIAYSLEDCLRSCSVYNIYNGAGCVGVSFFTDLSNLGELNGNCHLKPERFSTGNSLLGDGLALAYLQ